MRVLLTTDTVGGVWTYTKELTEGLLHQSHAVALVSFGQLPSADQARWCRITAERHPHRFSYTASETPLEWMDENGSAYSGAEDLLLGLADRFEPDLLHSNQFCFGKLPVSIPRLVVAHSDVLSWAAVCQPQGVGSSPWLDRYKLLVQTGLLAATALVAPTRWMLQALAQNFVTPAAANVIPNGRDIPLTPPPGPRELRAVSVGRLWDKAKGLALLGDVSSTIPINIAGDIQHGSQSAPTAIGFAKLLGKLDDDSLIDLFRSSSIYLALSVYEPFGLAPLEAALCGCAVLARDIPSLREVWGSAARYFEDAATLSSLLSDLAGSPALEDLRTRSFNRAQEMSRARMTELYLDLYQHLLEPVRSHLSPVPAEVSTSVT